LQAELLELFNWSLVKEHEDGLMASHAYHYKVAIAFVYTAANYPLALTWACFADSLLDKDST
jgi:hypothetical protein